MAWETCETCGEKTNGYRATKQHAQTHPEALWQRRVAEGVAAVQAHAARIQTIGELKEALTLELPGAARRLLATELERHVAKEKHYENRQQHAYDKEHLEVCQAALARCRELLTLHQPLCSLCCGGGLETEYGHSVCGRCGGSGRGAGVATQ